MADERLIVALDVSTFEEMKEIVLSLGDEVEFYKVGMELFYADGVRTLQFLQVHKKKVFLDLKLCDIPNTVAHGISSLCELGVQFLTIHGHGGRPMMEAAVKMAREKAATLQIERPKLLAITVLTSFDDTSWQEVGGTLPISERVIAIAKLAKEAGMDGVVASPLEAAMIREHCGEEFLVVTPGVRPVTAQANDQKRVATPAKALADGASHLVIGRPITKAENRQEAARLIIQEMEVQSL